MSKKRETSNADNAAATDAPKKRSKLKLALLALVPLLVTGGGGYVGWTFYLAPAGEEQTAEGGEHAAEGEAAHEAPDMIQVSAVPNEIAAETSFTHSFALAVILADDCGVVPVAALKSASDEEAKADGLLVNLSWQAAARRTFVTDNKTCRRLLKEVVTANAKAAEIAAARLAAEQGDGKGGHGAADAHDAKPGGGH